MGGAIRGDAKGTEEERERGSVSTPREVSPTFQPRVAFVEHTRAYDV